VQVYVRLAVASAVAAGVAWLVLQLGDGIADSGFVGRLLVAGVTGLVFAVLALGFAHLLRVREASQLLDPVVRRLPRRPS
jgi:putative peptidoglycan lipid II flippase